MTATEWVRTSRRYHRILAWIVALPLVLIFVTGTLLILRKDVSWIEPPDLKGTGQTPAISLDRILEIAKSVPEARISGWKDVARLDLQPKHGLIKLRTPKRWELQIDAGTGKVLGSSLRRTGFIVALHDGSFFGEWVPLYVVFPITILSIVVWGSGVVLLIFPYFYRL